MICQYGTPRLTGICRNVPGLACEVYYADLTAARMIAEGKPRKRAHVRQARGSVTTIVYAMRVAKVYHGVSSMAKRD
jgi:hypothetical protein